MNREVEERLVAMYFDNQDFEKHAKETINTLDQLKESMNLEDSVKGFDVFNKMKRNAGMEQMQRSANKLKDTFSSIGPILTKAFSIGAGPLKTLENAFSSIQGYVNKYLGFDFASKIVGGVENAIRGLTVQPVSQGWQQYENEVDSVKTIMSSTGETIQVVGKNLDDLRNYADKTVYSLNDMTSNLGKFTNNGVKLEDATKAMMGVTNAAALAGQGTQQASMAMYNISQAIGVGKMTSIDWKSIENANMATQQLKNTLIEVAAAKGQLKKVEKDGVTTYFVYKDSNGKEIKNPKKWQEVNFKNFRETLQKDWLDSDSLVATLMGFSGQNLTPQQWKALGIEDKGLINKLQQIGKEALEAASQVRTFSKLMGTLKDSVASGWSESFKFIFGNADEAAKLWTGVSDRIGGALTASATRRNDVLDKWKKTREVLGTTTVDSGSSAGIVEKTIYGRNGREILIDGLKNLADVFGDLGKAVRKAFGEVFGTVTGEDLFGKTVQFEKLTIRIKEWVGSMDDSNSRLNKIFRIVRGVLSAFKLWRDMIKNVANTLIKLLVPGASDILDILASVADFFYELTTLKPEEILQKIGEKIKQVWEKIKSWFTPKDLFDQFGNKVGTEVPILKWLDDLWAKLKTVGSEVLTDLGLGGFVEWLESVGETVKTVWGKIEEWPGWTAIKSFLTDVWTWITGTAKTALAWFTEDEDGTGSGFIKFITGVKSSVEEAWSTIEAWPGWEAIKSFLTDIWTWITGTAKTAIGWFTENEDGTGSGFTKFITGVKSSVEEAWSTIEVWPGWEAIKSFLTDVWTWITGTAKTAIGWFTENEDGTGSGFTKFITGVKSSVEEAWSAIEAWPGWPAIKSFLTDVWMWITGTAKTALAWFTEDEDGTGSGFVKFLNGFKTDVEDAWGKIVGWEGWPEIGKFLSDTWSWILGLLTTSANAETSADGAVTESTDNLGEAADVLADAGDAMSEVNENAQKFEEDVAPTASIFERLGERLTPVTSFFTEVFGVISEIVGKVGEFFTKNQSVVIGDVSAFLTGLGTFIGGLLSALGDILKAVGSSLHEHGLSAEALTALNPLLETAAGILLRIMGFQGASWGVGMLQGWMAKAAGIQYTSIASDIRDVGLGIAAIIGSIVALSVFGITEKDMNRYTPYILGAVAVVGIVIGIINKSLASLAEGKASQAANTKFDGTKVLNNLVNKLALVGGLWLLLEALPDVIDAISKAKQAGVENVGVEILITLAGVLGSLIIGSFGLLGVAKLADSMFSNGGVGAIGKGLLYAGAGIAAVIGIVYGVLTLIKNAFGNEKDREDLIENAKAVRKTLNEVTGILEDTLTNIGSGVGKLIGKVLTGGELTQGEMQALKGAQEQMQLETVVAAMQGLAETMNSTDIENLKDIFADLSSFASSGTFGQGLNLDNFSKGFTALATTLVGLADALTQNDSALFRVLSDENLEEKLYRSFDIMKRIMTVFKTIDNDTIQAVSDDRFFRAFDNVHELFSSGLNQEPGSGWWDTKNSKANPFYRFVQDINNMIDILLATFDFETYDVNEEKINKAFAVISSMSDSITKASDALDKLKALKDKYKVQSKQIAMLKDEIQYTWSVQYSDGHIEYHTTTQTDPVTIWSLYTQALEKGNFEGLTPDDFVDHYEEYVIDPGESLAGALEEMMSVFDHLIEVFENHPNLINGKYDQFAGYFSRLSDAFGMFAGENGVGSAIWHANYANFSDLVKDEHFVEKYVENIEKIYSAFEESDLGKENRVIHFNGIVLASDLFKAIQEGLNSDTLPNLDTSSIMQKIAEDLGLHKDLISAVVRASIEQGANEAVMPTGETGGVYIPPETLSFFDKIASGQNPLEGIKGMFGDFLSESAINEALGPVLESFGENGALGSMMSEIQGKLSSTLDLSKYMDENGFKFTDAEGNAIDVVSKMQEVMGKMDQAVNDVDPLSFKVKPVFVLDELTQANLQEQLNGLGLSAPITMPNVSIDFTMLKTELGMDSIQLKLDLINDSIKLWGASNTTATGNLGSHMDGIRNEISGMHMVLDSGVLVGQILPMIDRGLYDRALLVYRSGTAPNDHTYNYALPK